MHLRSFDWSKESERLWDERAGFWSSRSQEMWESGSRKDILPFFLTHVEKFADVCDLGCGDGYGTYKLTSAGY